ncbi:MAG: hypothetical protein ACI8WT_003677 [Clostridium sp.]|jgi:hypothetical protein
MLKYDIIKLNFYLYTFLKEFSMANEKIICYKCVYYYITWNPAFPKGCKFYGFKSLNLPSILVKQSSGISCGKFTPK